MSTTEGSSESSGTTSVGPLDLQLEVVVIPVSDIDRAKEFYGSPGWRLDADFRFDNGFRGVQFTPPGSASRSSSVRTDVGRARLRQGPLPDRLRRPHCSR